MKLGFVGYGALGRYVEATVTESLPVGPSDIAYFDDSAHGAGRAGAHPFAAYLTDEFSDYQFYVCLGYKHLGFKQQVVNQLLQLGRAVPYYIHPSSYVHPSVRIGGGSWLYPGCSIDRGTSIGNATWIANGSVIAHDCTIGSGCWFGASVTMSGHVTVGSGTFIASGSTIANDVTIGDRVIVGLATAVTKNVEGERSAIGNPMRILDRPLRLV